MRWKLLLIASLLAALTGAGAGLWLARALGFDYSANPDAPPLTIAALLLFPLAATTFAAIFVYRHTARRRALQATATALLAVLLTFAAFVAGLITLARPATGEARPSPTPHIKTIG